MLRITCQNFRLKIGKVSGALRENRQFSFLPGPACINIVNAARGKAEGRAGLPHGATTSRHSSAVGHAHKRQACALSSWATGVLNVQYCLVCSLRGSRLRSYKTCGLCKTEVRLRPAMPHTFGGHAFVKLNGAFQSLRVIVVNAALEETPISNR